MRRSPLRNSLRFTTPFNYLMMLLCRGREGWKKREDEEERERRNERKKGKVCFLVVCKQHRQGYSAKRKARFSCENRWSISDLHIRRIGSSGLRACGEPTNTELVLQAAPPHVRMHLYYTTARYWSVDNEAQFEGRRRDVQDAEEGLITACWRPAIFPANAFNPARW